MSQPSLRFEAPNDAAAAVQSLAVAAPAGHYDELLGPDGALRPAWAGFFEQLGLPGLSDLERRRQLLQRQVREHGVTYNVYGDEHGPARRWSLDLLPFIIGPEDWSQIEAGVCQRAALLAAMMADVYGEQRLLQEGLLPPALVLGNPGYLRPLHGVVPPGGVFLHLVAFDLARAADGSWWVASQRTQAPSGLGYALENRLIVSQLFGEGFASLRVQRLASSFRRLLDTLAVLAPRDEEPGAARAAPRIVLLTPGPYNETYFEQAYLARYLGTPLVVGQDLTVRDDRLYLKTLYGLERVHAVIRRLDDAFCDPLELRPDSALGVPGLVQAIRAGQVLVANAVGSGFLESHAIHGFLPAIAHRLLGQELLLPSRDTWWCGEEAARERALSTLDEVRIRPSHPGARIDPELAAHEGLVRLAGLREKIEADPELYTVQLHRPLSRMPSLQAGMLVPRSAVVRVYAIVDAEGNWHAMPGGLTRVADSRSEVSMQRGGSSVDTWVITGEPVDAYSMLPQRLHAEDVARRRRVVTSRAAENLFWMGRYSERSDNTVRAAQQVLTLLRGDESPPAVVLEAVARLAVALSLVAPGVARPSSRVFERSLLSALTDPESGSVAFDLAALARTAAEIRDRLAIEHWRVISGLVERFSAALPRRRAHQRQDAEDASAALTAVAVGIGAVTGAQTDGMTRDDGWRLLMIGRQIERLVMIATTLEVLFETHAVQQGTGFDLALALCNSTITYRSRYQGERELPALIDLLMLENSNPRSLACALGVIGQELATLARATGQGLEHIAPALVYGRLATTLGDLCERGESGRHELLVHTVRQLRASALELSDWLGLRYFSHSGSMRTLAA